MSHPVSVTFQNVTFDYPILNSHNMNLKGVASTLILGRRRRTETVRALDGISISFQSGERVLLTGQNGAGKTTLLKMIGGFIHPMSGRVNRHGSLLTLLDFSASLDSHLTGFENIRRMGVLLGATPDQVSHNVSEIANFTGLGTRLEHPVFTYSTGMRVRLSFSVATSFRRDIVIIDEGLGFADSEFMKRASVRLQKFVMSTGILILASHAAGVLDDQITRRIELSDGKIVNDSKDSHRSSGSCSGESEAED